MTIEGNQLPDCAKNELSLDEGCPCAPGCESRYGYRYLAVAGLPLDAYSVGDIVLFGSPSHTGKRIPVAPDWLGAVKDVIHPHFFFKFEYRGGMRVMILCLVLFFLFQRLLNVNDREKTLPTKNEARDLVAKRMRRKTEVGCQR